VVWRLRRLMILKRGRNLRAGQSQQWTQDWFNGYWTAAVISDGGPS
jgi:RNA-directed DNA polymerase